MKRVAVCTVALSFIFATAYAADVKLDGVKCIVNAKGAAKAEKHRDYKGGKVYFCCDNCPKKFDADSSKFATKANAQLVATGQATQTKCPISGQPCKADKNLTVAGAKVYFCCDMCKGKVEKTEGDDNKLEMVLSDKAWDKAEFKVKK